MDPSLKLHIEVLEQRELLKETERISEARRSAPMKSRVALPYDPWLARLGDKLISIGMRLKSRTGERYADSGLNVA